MSPQPPARSLPRVAFVSATNGIGGHEFQAVELVKLARAYCHPTVFVNRAEHASLFSTTGAEVETVEGAFLVEGKIHSQFLLGLRNRSLYRRLFRSYERVVVCAGAVEAGLPLGVGLFFSGKATLYLPFIYDRAVLWGWQGRPYTCLLHLLTNLYGTVVTINRIQARLVSRLRFGRTRWIPNEVLSRASPFAGQPEAARLVTIGRLDRQKAIPELIRDLDYPEVPFRELLVVGDGPERPQVEAAAREARFIHVNLLGWLDLDTQARLLSARDVLVVNSLIEGEPMVIREANGRGMLVLARDIPGVRGVTRRANRYRSSADLRRKLALAAGGELRAAKAENPRFLAARRQNAVRHLFA